MIATASTETLASAMAKQVKRVNEKSAALAGDSGTASTLHQRIAELEAEIARLQTLLQQREQTSRISAGGRELITPSQAAKAHGVSVATINRALNGIGARLEGIQMENGRWMVYADAPIVRLPRQKRGK